MTVSKAQLIAQQKYNSKNLDTVTFRIKKGKKEEYKEAADARGLGFMEMIRLAIEEYISNHEPIKNGGKGNDNDLQNHEQAQR